LHGKDDYPDVQLKVQGIHGLRIADGSIKPVVTTRTTMAPFVKLGEHAAHLIRYAHGLATGHS